MGGGGGGGQYRGLRLMGIAFCNDTRISTYTVLTFKFVHNIISTCKVDCKSVVSHPQPQFHQSQKPSQC